MAVDDRNCRPAFLVRVLEGMGWSAQSERGYGGLCLVDASDRLRVRVSWSGAWIRVEMGPWKSRFRSRWIRRALVVNRDAVGARFGATKEGEISLSAHVPVGYTDRDVAELIERMARYVRHYDEYLGLLDASDARG